MANSVKDFKVDTRPTKQVVVNSLTRDFSVRASVFDLIDNSIDAARDTIFRSGEERTLPSSYAGYTISIEFSGEKFAIEDNCGGISREHLAGMVMRFGEKSTHELGIGVFGVGLNRALFKLGAYSTLLTDTGIQRSEMTLDVEDYLKSEDNWDLPAEEVPSLGRPGTQISISKLPAAIAKDFSDSEWIREIREEIGTRYGQFIMKGLVINVGGVAVDAHLMTIRPNSPFPGEYKVFKAGDGVSVHLEYGQLNEHRFSNEVGYDKQKNVQIAGEYGWTVICNDRVILMADRSAKTGWTGNFHTEYYGFAGIASFEAADPSKLPWNTAKTDVDLNNAVYQLALEDMKKFATKWKAISANRKKSSAKGQLVGAPPPPPAIKLPGHSPPISQPLPNAAKPSPLRVTKPAVTLKPDHHQYRTLLPKDIDELHCTDKLLALVHEAKRMDIYADPYSTLALMRMLIETVIGEYCRRHGKAEALRVFAVSRRVADGKTLTEANKMAATPSMDELLAFLDQDPSVWGATKSPLKHSLGKMKGNQKELNGVLHNPFQQVAFNTAPGIRDAAMPILRHLIES
jgi:hypothetical protein